MIIVAVFLLLLCHLLNAVNELERVFRVSESIPGGYTIGFIHGQTSEQHSKQNFFIVFPPTINGKDNGAAEKLLHVDERTGEVALRQGQTLDFERERQLYVLAVPVDGSTPVSVIVELQDENDNAPHFLVRNVQLEISEYARINTVLNLPLARDADSAPFGIVRFRISSGNVNNAFRLAQSKSNIKLELVVNGRLDREYRSSYELLIEAIDGGRPPKVGSMIVQIEVLDVNDNHPEFILPRYSAKISRNTAPNIPILRVGAKDPDTGENGRVEYGIISQSIIGHHPLSLPSAPFQLDGQSGTLSLDQALPSLPHSITFDLLIRARDHGMPNALESSTTVEIIVDGTSDVLGGTSNVVSLSIIWLTDDGTGEKVPEGLPLGYVLARISIERSFMGANGNAKEEQRHWPNNLSLSLLAAQSMVCLRQTDTEYIYLLIVCGQFDREQMPALNMDLLVRNMSDVLLDHPFRLVLLDINDNAPRWNQSHFQFQWTLGIYEQNREDDYGDNSIRKNSGTRIDTNFGNYIRLLATDSDADDNGRVRYSIIGTDLFNIEPELGILRLDEDKLLNCPLDDLTTFQVQAEDHGRPSPLRSRVNITVRLVRAEPLQRVHFVQSVYEVRIAEDARPGTCVLQVSAVNDGLCGEKNNSSSSQGMQYLLEGNWSELFKLDAVNGMLCIKKELNVEQHGQNIQLIAMAKHLDGNVANAQVIVSVEDVNNHSPVFHPREYTLQLSLDMLKSQKPLLRVHAVDLDNSVFADGNSIFGKIHYRLGDGVGTELFDIDEYDAILRLNERGIRKLGTMEEDGEKSYGFELRVEATDEGGRTSDQMALINVRFVPSRFHCVSFYERIFYFRLSEETLSNIAIGDLRMIDAEIVRLEIVNDSDSARMFSFDETKPTKFMLKSELDSDAAGGEAHLLNVKATDSVKNCSNFSQIFVSVLDVNDNAPKFEVKLATIKLSEDFPIHKAFFAIKATDRDRNENGKITYEMYQTIPFSVPVQIHPNSGILSLSAPLDADSTMFQNSSILLRIRAHDHGIPQRHDTMELTINILDVNDNAPLFDLPEYEIEVPEDADLMCIVHRIKATDADITISNNRIRYNIHQILPITQVSAVTNTSVLGINSWTGEIFLRASLDREQCAKYAFEVEAYDSGIPSRMARVRMHLHVQDINDNAPVCATQVVVVRIQTGATPTGARVGSVQATDPDEGLNGTVRFRMQQPNDWFELNAKGELYLRRPIDATTLFMHGQNIAFSFFPRSLILIAEDQSVEMPLSSVCQVLVELDQNSTSEAGQAPKDEAGGGIRLLTPVQMELWLHEQMAIGTALIQINASGVRKWSIRPDDTLASFFSISTNGTVRLDKRPSVGEGQNFSRDTKQTITIQMDPYDNSMPKYLPILLRRIGGQHIFGETEFPPITITVPTNWSTLWQKPLYIVDKRPKNWTDQMFFRLEPVGLQSEKALEQGLFVLDELQGAFYMAKFPLPNSVETFVFHVVAHSLSDQFVCEKAVQLITVNLENWRRNTNRRRLRCAKTYQQWSISESTPIGTLIGRVKILGNGNDSSTTLKFCFFNANAMTFFRVNEFDGTIYIQKDLNGNAMSTVLLVNVSEIDEYGRATTVTQCAIRINVQADGKRISNIVSRNDIRFLSTPNVTIFMANLEQGLYPEGNLVHHFVAISERFPETGVTFEIAAGNPLGAFSLAKNGALSVPEPTKISSGNIFRLTIRTNLNNANKTHQRYGRVEQHFIVRVDHSNRKFTYFAQRHYIAEILADGPFTNARHQFVAKLKPRVNNICVNFALLPSLEEFKIDGEGSLEYIEAQNETNALLKGGYNVTLTVLAKRCANFSSFDDFGPIDTIDTALITVVPRRSIVGPIIEPTSCGNLSLPENEAIRQLLRIRTLLQSDDNYAADASAASPVVYAIEGGHWHNNLFSIDPGTGWISNEALDREKNQEHLLMISATDLNSLPKKADMCTVFITVIDRNDNAPVFDSTTTEQIHLPRSAPIGYKLAHLEAKDADLGDNGQIRYVMVSDHSGMFEIEWQKGKLIFARESSFLTEQSDVWIVIKAVDKGHPIVMESEPKRIHISWDRRQNIGYNNQIPPLVFTRQTYVADVAEGRPQGEFVAQLDVLNYNDSAMLSYSILTPGNHDLAFRVDSAGRVSTALELDAEIRWNYALQIFAIDSRNGQKAETRLEVNVLDVNDNAPFISKDAEPIRLAEDLRIGMLVTVINATDADITPTLLEYSLVHVPYDLFEINRWNGKVHLKRKLDFEIVQRHTLRVTDGLNRVSTDLNVEVLDVNDNAPWFVQPYIENQLSQDLPIGQMLAKVKAIDGDGSNKNSQLRYTLVLNAGQNSSTDLNWLVCDQNNGELRLRNAFTERIRTKLDRFVVIKATDSGQPPLSAYCTVRITVVPPQQNANEPLFDRQNYSFTLQENWPIHLSIGRLTIRQRQPSVVNCDFQLSYLNAAKSLQDNITRPKLRANFDGQIFVEDLLDREVHGEMLELEASIGKCPPQQRHTMATTLRQRVKVAIQIHIMDSNDNAPKFEETNTKEILISDSIRPGMLLTRFIATDSDSSDENSRLSYHLLAGDNFNQFSIGNASGELRIDRWNDAFALSQIEELSPDELVISAHDNGTPPQSAEWAVGVRVDWDGWSRAKPQFGVPIYRKFVPEDSPLGVKLFNVYADARRGGVEQTQCTYTIQPTSASSSMNETIVVEPTSGDVILIAPLDLETANISMLSQQHQQMITLHFNASCTGAKGKLFAIVPLEIRVYGVDEFAPTFTKNAYTFKLPHNFDTNKQIGQVVAIDRDIGYGSSIRYLLDISDTVSVQYVQISADQGVLTMVRMPLTNGVATNGTARGEPRVIWFTVWAESGWTYGSKQYRKRSSATVYIEISASDTTFNPSFSDDDHHHVLLSSFDLLSLLVLPTLSLCFCLISVLVLARFLLRPRRTSAKGVADFLRPAAPKKRMFSVATCRELQRHTETDQSCGLSAPFSSSFESGLFSYVKRTPLAKTEREKAECHATSVVPSSRSSSSYYVNMMSHRTSHLAANSAIPGNRRSAPDSGIDPDARSLVSEDSCAAADAFLAALGIVEKISSKQNARQPTTKNTFMQQMSNNDRSTAAPRDAFLDELIYACMDEIVPTQQQQQQTMRSSYSRNLTTTAHLCHNRQEAQFAERIT